MKVYDRVEAQINLDAIYDNLYNTRKIINEGTKLMAIVKADGYGHGAVIIAKVVDDIVDAYGVSNVDEAIELRKRATKKPILILGYTSKKENDLLVRYNITQAVFDYESACDLSQMAQSMGKVTPVHIKLDTGMTRIGFKDNDESIETIKKISKLPGVEITGIFTHFARADEKDKTSVNKQIRRYTEFVDKLEKEGIHIPTKHVANSASIIDIPSVNFNMVRSGISTYGLYPSEDVDKDRLKLKPAMEIKSCISFIKEVGAGVGISYGSTFVTERPTKVATIPVGYADGYPRNLSNKGYVLINGKKAPILGRVCMDQFMVDITGISDVTYDSEVVLLGKDWDSQITVEELADLAGTFNYEFVCDISKRVPRVFLRNNRVVATLEFRGKYETTAKSRK